MSNTNFGWICLLLIAFIPIIDGRLSTLTKGLNGARLSPFGGSATGGLFGGLTVSENGGADCATCSVVLGLIDKLTIVHNETVENTLKALCLLLPGDFKVFCKLAVEFLGKFIE